MIISASRRTDIPAFYSEWFMNRIRAGYCTVPNPFNPTQVSHVSLKPEDVDVIVFWTRNPRPLFPFLTKLKEGGYRYYFLYTLMDNPRALDPKCPPLEVSLKTFQELADRIGPKKLIWRYDPVVFSTATPADFHEKTYQRIAQALQGHTRRCVISILDVYRKAQKRFRKLAEEGLELLACEGEAFGDLMKTFVRAATENGMQVVSCAEEFDLQPFGIQPGKCVNDEYIYNVFGINVTNKKDPSQRKACSCVVSKDIGMYDTCLFGCQYCYATTSLERAKINHKNHDPASPSLVGWYDAEPEQKPFRQGTLMAH
jgi:hypothetical protein